MFKNLKKEMEHLLNAKEVDVYQFFQDVVEDVYKTYNKDKESFKSKIPTIIIENGGKIKLKEMEQDWISFEKNGISCVAVFKFDDFVINTIGDVKTDIRTSFPLNDIEKKTTIINDLYIKQDLLFSYNCESDLALEVFDLIKKFYICEKTSFLLNSFIIKDSILKMGLKTAQHEENKILIELAHENDMINCVFSYSNKSDFTQIDKEQITDLVSSIRPNELFESLDDWYSMSFKV